MMGDRTHPSPFLRGASVSVDDGVVSGADELKQVTLRGAAVEGIRRLGLA